jgi:hypothetical protein
MGTAWEEWKKKNAAKQKQGIVSPIDFINPATEYASDEEKDRRYSICQDCPHLTVAKTCTKCGCFMVAKTKLLNATCPENKW